MKNLTTIKQLIDKQQDLIDLLIYAEDRIASRKRSELMFTQLGFFESAERQDRLNRTTHMAIERLFNALNKVNNQLSTLLN